MTETLASSLRIDPEFRGLIPPLTEDERRGLERKLLDEGFQSHYGKILAWGDTIVDGHNRFEICQGQNEDGMVIPFEIEQVEFAGRSDAMQWVILNQASRRNLDPISKAELAEKLIPIEAEAAKERQGRRNDLHGENIRPNSEQSPEEEKGKAVEKAAKKVGAKKHTIYSVRRIKRAGRADLIDLIKAEKLSLNAAVRIVELYEKLSPQVAEAVEDLAHAGHRRVLNDTDELNRLGLIDQESPESALEVIDVIAGDDKPTIRSVFAAEKYLKNKNKPEPTPNSEAWAKFTTLTKRLHELSAGIDAAGGIHKILRHQPEQNQRIFTNDYRALAERALRQVEDFEQQKGGD